MQLFDRFDGLYTQYYGYNTFKNYAIIKFETIYGTPIQRTFMKKNDCNFNVIFRCILINK